MADRNDAARVRCGHCDFVFELQPATFTRRVGDIEETGFTCPICRVETVAVRTDSAIRSLQKRVQEERVRVSREVLERKGRLSSKDMGRMSLKLHMLEQKLKAKLDEFNGRA